MESQELQIFAKEYSTGDFEKIKFNWNGKHGEEFYDSNYDFRMKLCESVKSNLSICPDKLIIDLFTELSKSSKETFGVYNSYHLFANELLERGGSKYLDIYISGALKSFDTSLASARLTLSGKRIDEIIEFIKLKILESQSSNSSKNYSYMLARFEHLKNPDVELNETTFKLPKKNFNPKNSFLQKLRAILLRKIE